MSTEPVNFSYYLTDEARSLGLKFSLPRGGDAGFDLPSCGEQVIDPGSLALLRTGVHIAIPDGYVGLVRDRSSVALKGGVVVAGVIDSSYRGEVKVAMHNLSKEALVFASGERLAQCLLVPCLGAAHFTAESFVEASSIADLGKTVRGSGGFGSTGK